MNEKEKKATKMLDKFITEHKFYNIKHSDNLEDNIEIVLNLIEKLQKENEKLKNKLLDTLEGQKVIKEETPQYIKENYIPVQIIKDKIEKEIKYHERNILEIENITMLKSKTAKEEAEIEFNKYAIVVLKKILQELIEERSDIYENM